jgi:excinuclease ABC subunit C
VVSAKEKGLKNQVSSLPDAPGVYIFKDVAGRVLYVGKAKSLKKRVQSYFGRGLSSKTQALVSKVAGIEYMLSPSESQAQLLEAALIKNKLPLYNVSLKDDKSFPLLKISSDDFPAISICRRKRLKAKDKALYFGPYTNARLLRQALKTVRNIFGFRSCQKMPKKACLYYRLKLCQAPCIGKIDVPQYKEIIKQIKMFLETKYAELLDRLSLKMKEASEAQRFEEAAKIRDQLNALSAIGQGKPAVSNLDELQDLKDLLNLKKMPQRIEAFDISNISGKEATASMVSFYMGSPDKNNYRRFRIKTTAAINDYECLREVIRRRYTRVIKENLPLPDLMLIDGGRAHLLVADKEIKKIGITLVLTSIAKEKENIYTLDKARPINLKQDTLALNLIRRIRDEAHRFALAYHHLLHKKKIIGQ